MSLLAIKYNVSAEAFYIPGNFNYLADSISRFGQIARFMSLVYIVVTSQCLSMVTGLG